jgi:hypothetical protein
MSKKMITVSSPRGIILEAKAMGTDKDVRVGPHEPVDVPEDYGNHLIADRFVVPAEHPKAKRNKAEAGSSQA